MAKPKIAFKVNDIAASIAFHERLGIFTKADSQPETHDLAYLNLPTGELLLLAGPEIEDVRSYLDEPRIVFKPGDALDIGEHDLALRRSLLEQKGFTYTEEQNAPDGKHKITLQDPSDYKLVFYQRTQRTPEETVALYLKGIEALEGLVSNLTDEQLGLRRSPDEWNIRQIVHHLADSDSLYLMTLKTALIRPDSDYVRPPYDQERWAEVQDNAGRPIGPSLALSRAVRTYIVQLLQHIPNSWENSIIEKFSCEDAGRKRTAGGLLDVLAGHMEEHCNEIRETLQKHGL